MSEKEPPLGESPAADTKPLKQFLSDVMTAAGLVTHGRQCKALGDRIAAGSMRFLAALASKDAEIARLKTVPMKYRRMEFNAQLQNENEALHREVQTYRAMLPQLLATLQSVYWGEDGRIEADMPAIAAAITKVSIVSERKP